MIKNYVSLKKVVKQVQTKRFTSRKMKQHLRMGNSKRVQIVPAFWGQKCLEKGICPYSTKLQYHLIFITGILYENGPIINLVNKDKAVNFSKLTTLVNILFILLFSLQFYVLKPFFID